MKIETHKRDQLEYNRAFRQQYDGIQASKTKLNEEKERTYGQYFIENLALTEYSGIARTYCSIDESEFVGLGFI